MQPDISAYIAIMEEIKRRIAVVQALYENKANVIYQATQLESMILQVRMVTELIALSSLAANKTLFEKNRLKFEKHWHPKEILKDIGALNPDFYPMPIKSAASDLEGVRDHLVEVKDGFLTRSDLVSIHGRCGAFLHAKNPYGRSVDYDWYKGCVPGWVGKIKGLLNCHKIRLLDDDRFYLVHMSVKNDDRVHMYTFEPVAPISSYQNS